MRTGERRCGRFLIEENFPVWYWLALRVCAQPRCCKLMLRGKIVVVHIAKCVVVYFNLVCAVSSRTSVFTQGPGSESHDVDDDE